MKFLIGLLLIGSFATANTIIEVGKNGKFIEQTENVEETKKDYYSDTEKNETIEDETPKDILKKEIQKPAASIKEKKNIKKDVDKIDHTIIEPKTTENSRMIKIK